MARVELINVPPVEAIEHFRAKDLLPSFDWRDVEAGQHLVSFTVAKGMRLDIVADIREAVDRGLAEGTTFRQFRAELEPLLRKKGWWGRQRMLDPITGESRIVQLGSPRRLRTIFDTNLRFATARGRWERIERLKDALPYLRLVAVLDERTRPEHRAWHGLILPVDHSFWRTHFPPNGWHCRCTVQQLSAAQVEAYGGVSSAPEMRLRDWVNKRTGEVAKVPDGISPGFQHNVGLVDPIRQAQAVLASKVDEVAEDIAAAVKPKELDDYIAEGRTLREQMVAVAGNVEADTFPAIFRREMRRRLRDERGAGSVAAEVGAPKGGGPSAKRVRSAAQEIPAAWVREGNRVPLNAARGSARGLYRDPWHGRPGEISVAKDVGNPLHEYFHHLQIAMPGLDRFFRELHLRRTDGDPSVSVTKGSSKEIGRPDDYFRPYMGREYGAEQWPREMLPMAMQGVFHPIWGRDYLRDIVRDDPEILDLVLGVLFRYDP